MLVQIIIVFPLSNELDEGDQSRRLHAHDVHGVSDRGWLVLRMRRHSKEIQSITCLFPLER